jgi:hypothetical protein
MRLNGWQRIGIVASVIWAIGGPIYLDHTAQQEASAAFMHYYEACRDVPSNDPERCFQRASGPMILCNVIPWHPPMAL